MNTLDIPADRAYGSSFGRRFGGTFWTVIVVQACIPFVIGNDDIFLVHIKTFAFSNGPLSASSTFGRFVGWFVFVLVTFYLPGMTTLQCLICL